MLGRTEANQTVSLEIVARDNPAQEIKRDWLAGEAFMTWPLDAFPVKDGAVYLVSINNDPPYGQDDEQKKQVYGGLDERLVAATPLELLTLSACETTKGNDKAVLGLAGVAVKTGAKNVLASLWSVDDTATCYLMTAFYNYLTQGLSKANALQRAQRDLLETSILNNTNKKSYWTHCLNCSGKTNLSENYQHPAYWAAFLLVGNITN